MKLLFLIYVICLFVIFTPGIFFTLYKKNKVVSLIVHGLLFAFVFYLSSLLLNKKIVEGNTYTLNISDLSNLFDLQENVNVSSQKGTTIQSNDNKSPEAKLIVKNNETINRVKQDISGENKTLANVIKNEVSKMKQQVTNYKFNAKKANFICTMELPNYDFSKPQIESNSYNYYTSKTLVPGWNLNRAVLLNNFTHGDLKHLILKVIKQLLCKILQAYLLVSYYIQVHIS